MTKNIIRFLILILSPLCIAEDEIHYIGSFTKERFTEEHYYVDEIWIWEKEKSIIGLYLTYGGLQGSGANRPMILNIDKSSKDGQGNFTFNASSFTFVGIFKDNKIIGNLKNGQDNWDGGDEKSILVPGTHIRGINNPKDKLKNNVQWQKWADTILSEK